MGKLLSGPAPLRGRAGLELVVRPFGLPEAARFWGREADPALAVRVHAVIGGTPAYAREFVAGRLPNSLRSFDRWVVDTVLNPAGPLLREGRYLLAEELDVREPSLYHAVLSAIAAGHTTRGAIAAALGRESAEVSHPLAVLEDMGMVDREVDAFRPTRPSYGIADPFLRFWHAVVRPAWSRLQRPGSADAVWSSAQPTFASNVAGPHLEWLAREWTLHAATPNMLGGTTSGVRRGVVHDRVDPADVDVVALEGRRVLALGEAKWRRVVPADLARLARIRARLGARDDVDPSRCRLLLFSATGFARELEGSEAVLVGPDRLVAGV